MGLGLNRPPNAAGSSAPAIIIGCFVAFGGVFSQTEIESSILWNVSSY